MDVGSAHLIFRGLRSGPAPRTPAGRLDKAGHRTDARAAPPKQCGGSRFGYTASPLLYTLRSRVVNRLCDRPLRRWAIHIRPLPAPPALAPATTLILPSQRS